METPTRAQQFDQGTHAYVGAKPCGCVVLLAVDMPSDPTSREDNAREVSYCIREGFTVDRMLVEQARALPGRCDEHEAKAKAEAEQMKLFGEK